MLVVNRFRAGQDPAGLRAELELVHGLLAGQTGYVDGWVGRNLDDPDLWTLTTRWVNSSGESWACPSTDRLNRSSPKSSRAGFMASVTPSV